MSDSFNSPNQLSLEESQELTPEPNVTAVDAQPADLASAFENFEDDFDQLEAIAGSGSASQGEAEGSSEVVTVDVQQMDLAAAFENFEDDFDEIEADAIADSGSASNGEEEASFEVIADYIEAEVAATPPTVFPSNTATAPIASDSSEAQTLETAEQDPLGTGPETSSLVNEATERPEPSTPPVENAVEGEASFAPVEHSSEAPAETAQVTDTNFDAEPIETAAEEAEAVTESFDASVEVVDVEILASQEQERSYEVHQDGTLTYFQYFLDEEDSVFGPGYADWRGETKDSPRSFVSAAAVGVGVLAATFGAGLLMAEATNRNSISDTPSEGSDTQAKADAERKASEASGLAKASSPETTLPDWSTTQKAIVVSQGSDQANSSLGSAAAMLKSKTSPAGSSVTSKLAPLAQSWGTSVPLPPPALPIASPPVITTASLPTPTTVPTSLSAPRTVTSYQVIQPASKTAISAPLPSPPASATFQRDEQQLRARMDALRDRMADPIASGSVPTTTDGSLLDGPNEPWISNDPDLLDVPLNESGTTVTNAFPSAELPSLTDSPYGSSAVANGAAVMPPSAASISTATPRPIAAAPQTYPLDLSPVVPPASASSVDQQVVAPVAGLLPAPVAPKLSEPLPLPPRASETPQNTAEQVSQAARPAPLASIPQERGAMEVTPGAIALEVIPPALSTPVLTPVDYSPADEGRLPFPQASKPRAEVSTATQKVTMSPQGIQSLTELTGIQSSRPLAISRDTAQAALVHSDKLAQFRVLPLTVTEYQRLWQESGNDGTFAPVHGFVDYGQNLIAVVVPRSEGEQVGSAAGEGNSLKPMGQATAPFVTEVSAQPAGTGSALSRS